MKPLAAGGCDYRLMLCLGAGGVGKTTMAAALAVRAARAGRAVDVMTIDPAPRLLDALGLEAERAEPQPVALDALGPAAGGRLCALKLDPKATFDALVTRYAPSVRARDAIVQNRLYRNLSQALAGVGDYMAMEKLLELYTAPATDLVVLDTPPARQALDFLDAPCRVLELLNSRAAVLLGAPSGFLGQGLKLVDLAARAVLSAFDRLTGLGLLADVQAFVHSFDGMYQGFAERAERARALLHDPRSLLVVVTTAEAERVGETRALIDSLGAAGLRLGALVVNRTMAEMGRFTEPGRAVKLTPAMRRKLRRNWEDFAALKRREASSLAALRAMIPAGALLLAVPDLGREPETLADIARLGETLSAAEPEDLSRAEVP